MMYCMCNNMMSVFLCLLDSLLAVLCMYRQMLISFGVVVYVHGNQVTAEKHPEVKSSCSCLYVLER